MGCGGKIDRILEDFNGTKRKFLQNDDEECRPRVKVQTEYGTYDSDGGLMSGFSARDYLCFRNADYTTYSI